MLAEWEFAHTRWVTVEARGAAVARHSAIRLVVNGLGLAFVAVWMSGWAREGGAGIPFALLLGAVPLLMFAYGLIKRGLHLVLCVRPAARGSVVLDEGGLRWDGGWAPAYVAIEELGELRLVRRAFSRQDLLLGTGEVGFRGRMILLSRRSIAEARQLIDAVRVRRERTAAAPPAGTDRLARAGRGWGAWLGQLDELASSAAGAGAYRDAELGADTLADLARSWQQPAELRAAAAYLLVRRKPDAHLLELVEALDRSSPPLLTVLIALAAPGRTAVPEELVSEALRFVDGELRALLVAADATDVGSGHESPKRDSPQSGSGGGGE